MVETEITATLTDSDTYVDHVTWVWYRLTAREADLLKPDPDNPDQNKISRATTDAYTPVSDDIGMHLVAVASYFDRTYDENNDAT